MSSCAVHAEREARSRCARCDKGLCAECERTLYDKPYCADCEAELERKLAERQAAPAGAPAFGERPERPAPPPMPTIALGPPPGMLMPLLFAAGAGLLGAVAWAYSVILLNYKTGLVAIGVGWLVGFAAVRGARGQGSPALGIASLGVALAAMLLGEYLILNHLLLEAAAAEDPAAILPSFIPAALFFEVYPGTIGIMDFVFYAIGAYEAWKLPASAGRSA